MGKVPLDKKGNPTKKDGVPEGSVADGAERPTKKATKAKEKSSKGGPAPKSINMGSMTEGPPKKKKKVQKRTPPPHTSLVRDMTESMSALEDLVSRSLSEAVPSTTFTATGEAVPEPREAIPNTMAQDFTGDVGTPMQMATTENPASQFCSLEEEMAKAREDLRSPQVSSDEPERSQDFSVTEESKASSHQGDQSLEAEPT